jgi:DNA-binding FadR family transcriptional regulator
MEALEQLGRKLAQTEDADSRELWDSAFHRRIAEAAANTVLLALFDVVDRIRQQADWRRLRDAARTSDRLAVYVGQHEDILNAILCRDGDAAEAAMRDHLTLLQKNLRTLITGQRRAVQTLVAMMDQPPEKEPSDVDQH